MPILPVNQRPLAPVAGANRGLEWSREGKRTMSRLRTESLVLLLASAGLVSAAEPTAVVVEFHNSLTNQYFMTADSGEAAAVDAGHGGPGWKRTGGRFSAFAA